MSNSELKPKNTESVNIYDTVRRIEALTAEFPYEIKQLRIQVTEFLKKDKKLTALKALANKKANGKSADRVDSFKKGYITAYRRCRTALDAINRETDEVHELYVTLADYYAALGNRRDEKRVIREATKFENVQTKRIEPITEALNRAHELENLREELEAQNATAKREAEEAVRSAREKARREAESRRESEEQPRPTEEARREEPRQRPPQYGYQRPPQYQAPMYYYDPYRMPPPVYQQPVPSFNIAPISIDVNRAVDSAVESFKELFEERIGAFLGEYRMSKFCGGISSDFEDGEGEDELAAALAENIAENESFALDKLTALSEKLNGLLAEIGNLSEVYAKLEEKTKLSVESGRAVSEMQRALARELQGIQATQKVINSDQIKLAEEQAVVIEHQKLATAQSTEISASQTALSEEFRTLIETQNTLNEAMRGILESQNEIIAEQQSIIRANLKAQDVQKSLSERQAQLTEMQKDAIAAHKKLTRSQKAVNERLGAPVKSKNHADEHEDSTENAEALETTPEAVSEIAEITTEAVAEAAPETAG